MITVTPPVDLLRAALPLRPSRELALWARTPFLADHARQVLEIGRASPQAALPAMGAWFRRTRRLGSKDRPKVKAVAFGLVRHEALLRRVAGSAQDAALIAAFAALAEGDRFPDLHSEGPDRDLATALSLPLEIATAWRAQLGDEEAAALARILAERTGLFLRVNRAWGPVEAALALLAEDGVQARPADVEGSLEVEGSALVTATRAWREGAVEVQDLSSQAFCLAVGRLAQELRGQRVLDLCAGAGGKSLAFAAEGARVQAWDLRPAALQELQKRAARAGVQVAVAPPGQGYDLVVVDAPCSGTGRLRREPSLRWGLQPARHLEVQAALLAQGAERTRPGGLLAYATCSLLAAEQAPPEPAGLALLESTVCWPHRQAGDGFSWRVWRKQG